MITNIVVEYDFLPILCLKMVDAKNDCDISLST